MKIDTGTPYRVQPDLKTFFLKGLKLLHLADEAKNAEHERRIQQMNDHPDFRKFGMRKVIRL